jgi:hypothetical protein
MGAAARARAAKDWLDMGLHIATRPGAVDPTPGMIDALTNATDAIREAIEACGELHAVRTDLHLALDEAAGGIAALTDQGALARQKATRTANLAGELLERAIATLVEIHDTTPEVDAPAH